MPYLIGFGVSACQLTSPDVRVVYHIYRRTCCWCDLCVCVCASLPLNVLHSPPLPPHSQTFSSPSLPVLPVITAGDVGSAIARAAGRGAAKRISVQFTAQNLQICYKFHPPTQHARTT